MVPARGSQWEAEVQKKHALSLYSYKNFGKSWTSPGNPLVKLSKTKTVLESFGPLTVLVNKLRNHWFSKCSEVFQ